MTATPLRNVRVPDEEWGRALARAQAEGRNLSEVVREFIREYGAATPQFAPTPQPALRSRSHPGT